MTKTIEIIVSPQGAATVRTSGFPGADCLAAGKFLEESLGVRHEERKTAEFYTVAAAEQQLRQ